MKKLFKIILAILPILFATTSHAGVLGKAAKAAKAASGAKKEWDYVIDDVINTLRFAPVNAASRDVKVLGQLRNRAANLFDSKLSAIQKDELGIRLNIAYKEFRQNPLRLDSEWNKRIFIEQQTKILNRYSRLNRQQNEVASASRSSRKGNRVTVGTR